MVNARWHDQDWYRARLAEPAGPVRLVIDTDCANEIDDQFALAWALLSPRQLDLQAVYAAPFSFDHRRREMLRARAARAHPASASAADHELLRQHAARLDHFERQGWPMDRPTLPVFNPPAEGMERSHAEILKVFELLRLPSHGLVHRGSTRYLQAGQAPPDSPALQHLVQCARSSPPGQPLYVVALGCATNIAAALLAAPDIAERIVVVWTAGYPSHAPHTNFAFNLEQDMLASQLLFNCGVPLVYLPGFHVGAQLRLSLPEVQRHVQGCGAIGAYLHHLFSHNPLWDFLGLDAQSAPSWVIWDLINIAWLLQPAWVPSGLVATPVLGDDRRWHPALGRHPMREAYAVARDAIFIDLFEKLSQAPG